MWGLTDGWVEGGWGKWTNEWMVHTIWASGRQWVDGWINSVGRD